VFTGSSKVFINGQRAARMGDITRHCMPGGPLSALDKLTEAGMGLLGGGAEVLDLFTQRSDAGKDAGKGKKASDKKKDAEDREKAAQDKVDKIDKALRALNNGAQGGGGGGGGGGAPDTIAEMDARMDAADAQMDADDEAAEKEAEAQKKAIDAAEADLET